jgi:phosphogluconate dehydratase
MLMEIMGLHLPGASFVNPGTPLRDALTRAAARRVTEITARDNDYTPIGEVVDERAIVNAIVGLHATGGSTNHTIHLIAMARAAGIVLTWEDFAALSDVVPLLARVYPNGLADVNHFHAAGGLQYMIGQLLDAGLLHDDVMTVVGRGLSRYTQEAKLMDGEINWIDGPKTSHNDKILRPASEPFHASGGLRQLKGNLGQGVMKVSAVAPERHVIEAKARIFEDQETVKEAFRAGDFTEDTVIVVRFQGPAANGMPELHSLTPVLAVLQDRGLKVALVTDGRMSGASGKVPSAIHVAPEAAHGGPLARLRDGDLIRVDAVTGTIDVLTKGALDRPVLTPDLSANEYGTGRELFALFRRSVSASTEGAGVLV